VSAPEREPGPLLSPGFWLHHAALTWRAQMDARLRPVGLTHTQFMLLATMGWLEHVGGGPPTQQQVADRAGADRQMTSRVIRGLRDRGLVERRAHESNARALRLTLTAEGRALTAEAIAIVRDLDEELFGPDSGRLRDGLRSIAEHRGRNA
jgi:DNA-binding MarR family transcriptional regulator